MSNKQLDLIEKHQQTFTINQGMTSLEVCHTFDQLLGLQLMNDIKGDILEIGVLQGATISFLASSLQNDERAFLIDPYQNLEQIKQVMVDFAQIDLKQILSFPLDSKFVAKRHPHILGNHNPLFRFIHIDGEHSYDAVYSDLQLSSQYLAEGGLIVLDDIFSLVSACCTHAMFDYLNMNPNLHCIAMGFNKAYICESKYINFYRKFFLHLPDMLTQIEDIHIRLCFNSWGHERSYVTFHRVKKNEPKYQVIGQYLSSLEEVADYLNLNMLKI